ncbi:uncharacterized protein GGS22DRAFT_158729 [Annulohypoxylon maeteangense]|uniref:uncharacterized protein n=1 Tax=Annulohypoxylon maeteangense TaxID=1927788 RepID=UPI002008C840|nr:uncharacterized protein GGS22DRAFT_158729 [Annulohypoxylon maeteangense]KAI0886805.1 hypothetical protein GGS22DRAFT_158729 [Annulohypoxylon maeteangense]
MQFAALSLSLFAAFVAAQNSTSLPDLVSQLPSCAAACLSSSAKSAGCSAEDFTCLCGNNKDKFISSITGCIALSSGCSQSDIGKLSTLAPEICTAVAANPDASAVASASKIVSSAIGTASATSTPGAAVRPEVGMGLFGAAALAAFAL